jgi:hypothetical protein
VKTRLKLTHDCHLLFTLTEAASPEMTSIRSRLGSTSGTNDASSRKSATPIRIQSDAIPLPIARRPSVSGSTTGSVSGSATTSMLARPTTSGPSNITKSYVSSKSATKGVPIFVGSGSHTHAQARASSIAPATPLSLRRSQTPVVVIPARQSVAREFAVPSNSYRAAVRDQRSRSRGVEEQQEIVDIAPRSSSRIQTRNNARNIETSRRKPMVDENGLVEEEEEQQEQPSSSSQIKQKTIGRRPANPPSAYVLFSKEVRPGLIQEAGSLEGAKFNINTRVKEEWLALTEEGKDRYRQDAAQRKQIYQSLLADYERANPEEASRGRNTIQSEPVPPTKAARQLFKEHFLATTSGADTEVEQAWIALGEEERSHYDLQVQEAEERYLAEKEEWDRQSTSKQRKSKRKTISDDEAEYLLEVDRHGPALKAKRVDTRNTAMADLSSLVFKKGRASKRTFDMERKLKAAVKERQRVLNERRAARLAGIEIEEEALERRNVAKAVGADASRGESETEVEEDEDEEIIEESDAESMGAASEAMPPLRDNRFTVRTRIVNGQLVLDESSLQQSRNDEAITEGGDFLDVNEEDRFVNSSTFSKRIGTDRWDAQETQAFLKAVSMWGSDFEMISRMFSNRNRKQIKAKWRSMERLDSRSLDLAFRRKLPVDLDEYGRMAGVDLSGEAPKIEARIIKKAEEEEQEEGHEQREQIAAVEEEVELDENGLPIIEEAGDEPPRSRRAANRKKSATPLRKAKSKSPSIAATEVEEVDEEDELPTAPEAMRLAASKSAHKERATSTTSNASHRPRAGSTSGVSAAAEAERLRQEKKQKDEQRKERERLRRRSVPTNEEEVVE